MQAHNPSDIGARNRYPAPMVSFLCRDRFKDDVCRAFIANLSLTLNRNPCLQQAGEIVHPKSNYLAQVKVRNVEIKARCVSPQRIRDILTSHGARYVGRDHQIDTYYQTPNGRLKLRRGNIENALIAYTREDVQKPKLSDVQLYKTHDPEGLQNVLNTALEILVVVDKTRDIYFIDNVKFHIDEVRNLGTFAEIEAIDDTDTHSEDELRMQVMKYMELLGIAEKDLLTHSYSDMLLQTT